VFHIHAVTAMAQEHVPPMITALMSVCRQG